MEREGKTKDVVLALLLSIEAAKLASATTLTTAKKRVESLKNILIPKACDSVCDETSSKS